VGFETPTVLEANQPALLVGQLKERDDLVDR
jgi:hypothetical protein